MLPWLRGAFVPVVTIVASEIGMPASWADVSRLERYRTNVLLACLTKVRC